MRVNLEDGSFLDLRVGDRFVSKVGCTTKAAVYGRVIALDEATVRRARVVYERDGQEGQEAWLSYGRIAALEWYGPQADVADVYRRRFTSGWDTCRLVG